MSNIMDQLAEQKSRQSYYASKEAAQDQFDQQKSALEAIKDTVWFEEIRRYRISSLDASLDRFWTAKGDDLLVLQGAITEWKKFLDYLNNITTPIR